jgi:hypothetical protein
MKVALLCAVMIAVASSLAKTDVVLVRDGAPVARIVAVGSAGAAPAQELQACVERMSDAKLEIVTPDEAPASRAVFVGATSDFASLPFSVKLGPHAFIRKTTGDNLYLVGADAEGTAYAVCDLLEDFGCRWFMPGEIGEVIPRLGTVVAKDCDIAESPAFESRQMWYAWGATTPEAGRRLADWQRHNKVGWLPFGHGHNFSGTVPPDKYFKEHPEYYALVRGKRQTSQLCTTNPDVIRIAIDAANRFFDQNPQYISYSLCPDDNASFCECPNCRALDIEMDPHLKDRPNVTDRLMVFWNAVAEGVQQKHPGKRVAMYAYINHTLPPKREKVHPGVMPVVTTSVFCPIHSVADTACPSRQELRRILESWTRMAQHVYIYEYDPIPGYAELPCPLYNENAAALKVYRDIGIKGFSFETHQSWATTFPNFYMVARLMWNPDENPEAVLDDMCDKFLGPAAAPMRRYYRLAADAFAETSTHTTWGSRGLSDVPAIWTPEIMRDCRAALDEALAKADDDTIRRRVEMVDMGFQYLEAFRVLIQGPARDYDAAAAAAEKCSTLIDRMFGISDDYIVAHESHNRVDELKAGLTRYFTTSQAFRRDNDVIAILPVQWRFAEDPQNNGVRQGWASRWFDDAGWRRIRTDRQWYQQLGRPVTGYGWVRTRVFVPEEFVGRRIMLWIGALDEQGWIYVNGRLAFRRKSDEYDAWRQPFECDITPFIHFGEENTIAVRAFAESTLGGLWQRAMVYAPK